jgi:NAD(P)-dependent dehydrogenase (short-subunit alcohol dehydrogenase family)
MNAEQPVRELVGRTAIVVGAGRGLGRGIATALADAGAPVVAVARDANSLESLAHHHPGTAPVESWLSVLLPRMQTTEEKGNRHDAQDRNT